MNRKINFDTANNSFIRIIGNGIHYEVPPINVIILGKKNNGMTYGKICKIVDCVWIGKPQ